MQIFGNCSVYPEEKFILHNIMQISFLVDGALQVFIIFHEAYGQVGESHLKTDLWKTIFDELELNKLNILKKQG